MEGVAVVRAKTKGFEGFAIEETCFSLVNKIQDASYLGITDLFLNSLL